RLITEPVSATTSEAQFAVRTEAHQFQIFVVRLSVDENEVRPDVAVAVILPLATKPVIEIPARQWRIGREHGQRVHQEGIELLAVPAGLLASVIALEARRIFNRPHSIAPKASWRVRQSRACRGARPSMLRWF